MQDPITSVVVAVFAMPGAALLLAGLILAAGIGLIVYSGFTEFKALREELTERWNLLSSLRGADGRKQFHDQFAKIDVRFSGSMSSAASSAALVLGWSNFRSLLADTGEGTYATSARAAETFDRLDEPARSLEWWANILVAIGLAITFMGIVAALSEATAGMGQGDSGAMQKAISRKGGARMVAFPAAHMLLQTRAGEAAMEIRAFAKSSALREGTYED